MVGAGLGAGRFRGVGDRWWFRAVEVDVTVFDELGDGVAGQDVVDQFGSAAVDPTEPIRCRDPGGQIPEPLGIALVWLVEAAGANLGAGRSEKDLGGGRFWARR